MRSIYLYLVNGDLTQVANLIRRAYLCPNLNGTETSLWRPPPQHQEGCVAAKMRNCPVGPVPLLVTEPYQLRDAGLRHYLNTLTSKVFSLALIRRDHAHRTLPTKPSSAVEGDAPVQLQRRMPNTTCTETKMFGASIVSTKRTLRGQGNRKSALQEAAR